MLGTGANYMCKYVLLIIIYYFLGLLEYNTSPTLRVHSRNLNPVEIVGLKKLSTSSHQNRLSR